MQAKLTPAIREKLKNLVEIQVYLAEAQKQIPVLQEEIACALFPDLKEGIDSHTSAAGSITCCRNREVSLAPGALDRMSQAQRDWLTSEGVLVGGDQINQFHYNALTSAIKSTLSEFLLVKISPVTITVELSNK